MSISNFSQPTARQRVIAQAYESFRSEGIKDVRMDDIARMLHMSKRTIYQLFSDKEELVIACLDYGNDLVQKFGVQCNATAQHRLETMLKIMAYHLQELNKCTPKFFVDLTRYPSVMEHLAQKDDEIIAQALEFMHTGVDEGYFLPGLNYAFVMRSLLHQFKLVLHTDTFADYSLQECFHNLCVVTFRGCATAKGVEYLDNNCTKLV